MITILVEENNTLTPNFYNSLINNLQFHRLTCPCGHSGCLSVHGYYHRYIKTCSGRVCFRICRVKCECCGHTHAILLSSMIPYSQISLENHISIIHNYEQHQSQEPVMNSCPSIDESCIHAIIRKYLLCWKQKLLSERISFTDVPAFVFSCFSHFNRQFMQIKNIPNILFLNTT